MALDGITIAAVVKELNDKVKDCRIAKIAQPDDDELILTIKGTCGQVRFLISANPSLPFAYLSDENKPSPLNAPAFCMALRKHISNGKIVKIEQPGLERIIVMHVEQLDEMGDMSEKKLIIELMGKHSNIIFTDKNDNIIDAIKHIGPTVSSVRLVLPGREYFIPNTTEKLDPLSETRDNFILTLNRQNVPVNKFLYTTYSGISPLMGNELANRAGLDGDMSTAALSGTQIEDLYNEFKGLTDCINNGDFKPCVYMKGEEPTEFSAVRLSVYESSLERKDHDSISETLSTYYREKEIYTRVRQKSTDIRKIISNAVERDSKKRDIQAKQLKDTDKMDKYRVYGELIHTYGYTVKDGEKSFEADNYYTGEKITIPLDPEISVMENAERYFNRYNKLKRTKEAVTEQLAQTEAELDYLATVTNAIDIAQTEADLNAIRDELSTYGLIKKKNDRKKGTAQKSKPLHYVTDEGFHIYVGKNNIQNDELTFKLAGNNDWWFHSKKIPGSHVVVKTEGKELPDSVFEKAAAIAAFYSQGKSAPKVEIDYVLRREVKKPAGSAPGFVVYYTNYSMMIKPEIPAGVREE
ncbi:MAG: NFACT family protein, partial [Lachnospiraceae bacterium]|nr:NFACT family protein [Lachnospiraceae bacterium]